MNRVESSFGGQIDLMLDIYSSAIPFFFLPKCLKSSFVGSDAITVVKNDGLTNPSETFGYANDLLFPSAEILSFLNGEEGRVSELWVHNTGHSYTQTTISAMPIIADAAPTNQSIITDSEGNIALKFTGSEFMEMPNSQDLFNAWHNGISSAFFGVFEKTNASSTLHLLGNRDTSGGSTGFAIRVRSSNRFNIQIYSFGNQGVFYQPSSLPADDSRQIWIDIDADATIAADRSVVFSDGNEFSGNTRTEEVFKSDANTNMQIGTFDYSTARYQGYISALGGWDTDQSANRTEILNYL